MAYTVSMARRRQLLLQQISQTPMVAATLKRGEQTLPKFLTVVLVGVSLWLLAAIVWKLIPVPDLPVAPVQSARSQAADSAPSGVNVAGLKQRDLFGKAGVVPRAAPKQETENAPDTRLNLTLAGVILSDDPNLSRAFIGSSNGKQKSYAIDDDIEGASATLYEVHATHVILERNGRYETLRLQKTVAGKSNSSTRSTQSPSSSNGDVATKLKSVREEILRDPSKAADFIRVRPVYSKGQLTGYRIYPGKDRGLFTKVGLRSGDLVTKLNGQGLNDPQKAFSMLSTLSNATSISLELQRRGRTENVSVDLGS